MSDRESQQASIDASEASLPAENGSREVENDPPPLGRAEESVSDAGVAARTRFQRRLQNVAGADIIDPARIADPPTRSDPPEESTSARAAESSAPNAASSSLQGVTCTPLVREKDKKFLSLSKTLIHLNTPKNKTPSILLSFRGTLLKKGVYAPKKVSPPHNYIKLRRTLNLGL